MATNDTSPADRRDVLAAQIAGTLLHSIEGSETVITDDPNEPVTSIEIEGGRYVDVFVRLSVED